MTEVIHQFSNSHGSLWARENPIKHALKNQLYYQKNKKEVNRRRKIKYWTETGKNAAELEYILSKRRYQEPRTHN